MNIFQHVFAEANPHDETLRRENANMNKMQEAKARKEAEIKKREAESQVKRLNTKDSHQRKREEIVKSEIEVRNDTIRKLDDLNDKLQALSNDMTETRCALEDLEDRNVQLERRNIVRL